MGTEKLLELIVYAPFAIVTFIGVRRYLRRGGVNRLKPFFVRMLVWHIGVSLLALAIYAISNSILVELTDTNAAARGCGQGLMQMNSDYLSSCPELFRLKFSAWFALSCIFFGAAGIGLLAKNQLKHR